MKQSIFCIIGETGVGKSTYFGQLMIIKDILLPNYNIKPLIYHTTRAPRKFETANDYIFDTNERYQNYKKEDKILELREYSKYDCDVAYYTLYDDIKEDCDAYICTASVDQVLSYINSDKYNVYIISITMPLKNRMERSINRCNSNTEIYELCRRVLEEENEYNKINTLPKEFLASNKLDIWNYTSNENKTSLVILNNLRHISEFIIKKLSK